ncbi:MAG: hypothetical protein HRU41_32020 [Saprospiraceae bacterium]|nr:hypothetical protein [Saprospiraceae bacterium]
MEPRSYPRRRWWKNTNEQRGGNDLDTSRPLALWPLLHAYLASQIYFPPPTFVPLRPYVNRGKTPTSSGEEMTWIPPSPLPPRHCCMLI